MKIILRIVTVLLMPLSIFCQSQTQRVDQNGEPFAEDILNGKWKYPPSIPVGNTQPDPTGFAFERLAKVPKPSIHPRILFSPEELPSIRQRIESSNTGKQLLENLEQRTAIFNKKENWEAELLEALTEGNTAKAKNILDKKNKPNGTPGHYQNYFVYEMMLRAFKHLVFDEKEAGKKIANAFYYYVKLKKPIYDSTIQSTLYKEDAWRSGTVNVMDYHFIAYLYDFTYNNLTLDQREEIRAFISKYTNGRITLGMKIPSHFRNWNWIMVAQSFVLNALAIEGEKGYDERVYKKSVEVVHDYLSYAISESGVSTEAVGYTAFGFYWGCPAMVAMSRRGDNMLIHPHYKAMKNWYLHTLQPYKTKWSSHGDGGDGGPSVEQIMMMKYYYPSDSLVDYLFQQKISEKGKGTLLERMNIILPLIFAQDPNKDASGALVDYKNGGLLKQPLNFVDLQRGTLITRSDWTKDATYFTIEARKDGIGASHEHADRGNFNLSALGRGWSLDGFRGVESKYHNVVLIDGKGQGYFPTPATSFDVINKPEATFASCNIKYAYDWRWPKPIETSDPSDKKFTTERYKNYLPKVLQFRSLYHNQTFEKDPSPHVVAHYKPYLFGNPLQWDEDGWPVRVPFNPVKKAFRTAGLVKGKNPYILIVDDIQKDDTVHLYEWNMMLEWDLSLISIDSNDIVLGQTGNIQPEHIDNRNRNTARNLNKGEPLLLVRILNMNTPDSLHFEENPSPRVETFEKINTLFYKDRTFGLDKRLVIPTRAISPDYIILLYPYRHGDKLPFTQMKKLQDGTKELTIIQPGTVNPEKFLFKNGEQGKTMIRYTNDGKIVF